MTYIRDTELRDDGVFLLLQPVLDLMLFADNYYSKRIILTGGSVLIRPTFILETNPVFWSLNCN